jgi:peptidyl-prolyl cis-trans isomerase SurA
MSFNEAASKYSDDESAKFTGPFVLNRDGSPYVTIDQLDKEMVAAISKMNLGDISAPVVFTAEQEKKGVRIIYFKSRSEPHRMNLRDDYSKVSSFALEEKKAEALQEWLAEKIPTYYIMVDGETAAGCPQIQKYKSTDSKGF